MNRYDILIGITTPHIFVDRKWSGLRSELRRSEYGFAPIISSTKRKLTQIENSLLIIGMPFGFPFSSFPTSVENDHEDAISVVVSSKRSMPGNVLVNTKATATVEFSGLCVRLILMLSKYDPSTRTFAMVLW